MCFEWNTNRIRRLNAQSQQGLQWHFPLLPMRYESNCSPQTDKHHQLNKININAKSHAHTLWHDNEWPNLKQDFHRIPCTNGQIEQTYAHSNTKCEVLDAGLFEFQWYSE